MYMGSANQKMNVIWDTGSDWLVVDTDFCVDCLAPTYTTAASSTFVKQNTYVIQQSYGSANLYGYRSTDTVSAQDPGTAGASTQITAFPFIAVNQQTGL